MNEKTKHALKLSLEALKELRMLGMNAQWHDSWLAKSETAITTIREALAEDSSGTEQPAPVASPHEQQEPVAWAWKNTKTDGRGVYWENPDKFFDLTKPSDYEWTPLYTSPPASKPWVGLTDEDIAEGQRQSWVDKQAFESAAWWAEAKLREKNA